MQKRWVIKKHDHERSREFADQIGVSPLAAALLIARGHDNEDSARSFLDPSLSALHDPYLLKGMRESVKRIRKAIKCNESILIWGDYDVDGTTGTSLLRKVIKMIGGDSRFHIPNRFSEGYGVNTQMLQKARSEGVTLAITVDCGIRSFEPLEWARENGLDVIVTDHHLSDETRGNPPAFSVVNPNQPGCPYPDKNLAGVGVAFKLAHALLREANLEHLVPGLLKIAAIGTVADIVKLTGENRAIVSLGLKDLTCTTNLGLKALMEIADCRSDMTSYHIGFRIAPRINAAGRMDVANTVVELFEASDFTLARRLAEELDVRNRERQKIQQDISERALFEACENLQNKFVVVAGEGWHRGVIGLAASRIADRLNRPTIVLSVDNEIAHGSARSIGNYHLIHALESCVHLFEQFGGHAAAAGLQIRTENIEALRSELNAHAASKLSEDDLIPVLDIDAHVSAQTLDLSLISEIARFEPFGAGNPKPVFITKGLVVLEEPRVMKDKHLKLWLLGEGNRRFEAVWWDGVEQSMGRTLEQGTRIQLAYTAEANTWNGNTRLQLVVEDLRADN